MLMLNKNLLYQVLTASLKYLIMKILKMEISCLKVLTPHYICFCYGMAYFTNNNLQLLTFCLKKEKN